MKIVKQAWLAPSTVRWPDSSEGPWAVTLTWREANDRAECSGFSLAASNPHRAQPVTATLLRSLPIGTLIADARRERYLESGGLVVEAIADGHDLDVGEHLEEQLREAAEPWREQRRGRPATEVGPAHFEMVAEIYTAAVAANGAPLRAVERHWTVSRATASRWIAAARAQRLLPPTDPGQAKGNPLTQDEITEGRR